MPATITLTVGELCLALIVHQFRINGRMMELSQFRKLIEDAFANVPYPGDDNITNCGYKKTFGGPCFECRRIADYFRGKTWHGHKVKNLRYHESALNLLTEEALHYYLPAFVLAELEDSKEADVIYDGLIFIFTDSRSSRAREFVKRLSQAQRRVMIEYFQSCLEKNGEYLDDYISQAIAALSE